MDAAHAPRPLVILAGGGPAALEAALALRSLVGDRVRLELASPDRAWAYRPLSVLEPFAEGRPRIYPLAILERHHVDLRQDGVVAVDPAERTLRTTSGDTLGYDALLVATGADHRRTYPHATNALDAEAMHGLVQDVELGAYRRIAFAAPLGASWTLPLYELALGLAERADDLCLDALELTVVTHEQRPLATFGTRASDLVERLLAGAGIALRTGVDAATAHLDAERVVALPEPVGRSPRGLPATLGGFLPVDAHGRVLGATRVYAAGDVADRPLKQGGLATQQADAAAAAIAADLGLHEGLPAAPAILRGVLIAGSRSFYLRRSLPGDPAGEVSTRALWWPPTKIAGRFLTAFLDGIDADTGQPQPERRIEAAGRTARKRAVIPGRGDAAPPPPPSP